MNGSNFCTWLGVYFPPANTADAISRPAVLRNLKMTWAHEKQVMP